MTGNKDQAFKASVKELKIALKAGEANTLKIFKEFRRVNEERLLAAHKSGGRAREICRQRSELTDIILRELFVHIRSEKESKGTQEPLVVAAFGGYGRRELNPFSDVDITFLTESSQPRDTTEEIIRTYTLMLWDIGFKIGHSVRSVSQGIEQANEDFVTKTSMLESRFLFGPRKLYQNFVEHFIAQCVTGREQEYLIWRREKIQEQRKRFGASIYMQEPNVKTGAGGMRDYQNLLWVANFTHGITSMRKLVEKKFLRETERKQLETGFEFLLRVRSQLHYLNKRASDQLTLQMQGRVATAFGYPQKSILRRCEAFMRDYYSATRSIEITTTAALARIYPDKMKQPNRFLRLFTRAPRQLKFDGLIVKEDELIPESRDIFTQDPNRLMRVFWHMQLKSLLLSPTLRDLVRRRLSLINRTFQYAKANREIFLSILSRKGEVGRILREMHNTGFLGKFIPEFAPLTCLVQHEFFHRYTADEHTLVCIEKLDEVLFTKESRLEGYRPLFQKLEDPAALYFALLLHDTGKATNRRSHEEASTELAQKAARRLQLASGRRRMLLNLVNNHYLLSHTAQTRNLDDPATIQEFCGIVQNASNLDALMLLTLADGMGTSDERWSDWKESLVWTLYKYAKSFFESGTTPHQGQMENMDELWREVMNKLPKEFEEEGRAHFSHMPDRYFAGFDPADIADHLRLFRKFFENFKSDEGNITTPAIQWIDHPDQGHSEVHLCGWDRDSLLQRIAGAFVAENMNILSADAYTRGDNLVLDIFRVSDASGNNVTSEESRKSFQKRLFEALQHQEYDFRPFFKRDSGMVFYRLSHEAELPTKINVQNSSHPIYSLVEIQTPDRLGLLYDLLHALGEIGVNIELSRITTEMDVATDTFYITTKDGKKLSEPWQIEKIQDSLKEATRRSRDTPD
ncbi:MAG: [protein-PII] uridylyltransferase [Chthoniobacterales bacterium]